MTESAARLEHALRAGARGLALTTDEEDRAIELAEAIGERLGWPVHTWSAADGIDDTRRPVPLTELLERLARQSDDELWLLLDATASVGDAAMRRALRGLAQATDGPAVVLVQPDDAADPWRVLEIPELVVERLPRPDLPRLRAHVTWIGGVLEDAGHRGAKASLAGAAPAIAHAALGLTLRDVERMVAEAVTATERVDADAILSHLAADKATRLDRHRILEATTACPADELGGLGHLKTWLRRRALALRPEAAAAAIPPPRGVLILGVQGCGKSIAARVCADILELPIVRLDPGRLFGETVGRSEANLRRAIDLVERLAPTVLWLDEIDKGLAGSEHAASDGGTTARVIGTLLTWMQERRRPVFIAATANRVDALPPELMRRGRLDETFFVDLPDADEREEILRVHLWTRPHREQPSLPPPEPWDEFAAVAREAHGLSGAEIEAAVVEARLDAFAQQRSIAPADLQRAVQATVPLSRTRAEDIDALRRWAEHRARPA